MTSPLDVPALQALGFQKFQTTEWREGQADIVRRIINSPKKFIVCQAPTGSGKSVIALAAARLLLQTARPRLRFRGAVQEMLPPQVSILTATKQLQAQYTADFMDVAKEVKGRNNFPCHLDNVTAAEGLCTVQDVTEIGCKARCPYYVQKAVAERSPVAIHSYAYYLNAANYTDSFTSQELLVLDEGHLLDDMLMSFISSSVRETTCRAFSVSLPEPGKKWTWTQWQRWSSAYHDDLAEQLDGMVARIESDLAVRRRYKAGGALLKTMEFLRDSREPWVCVPSTDGYDFMPVWVGQYAGSLLYRHAKKVLVMSATVLDPEVFCRTVSIPVEEMEFIDIPSDFPVGARPIYYDPVMPVKGGQVEAGYYDLLVARVHATVARHPGEKGLIHCVSYQIAREVMAEPFPKTRGRMMTHGTADRLDQYNRFRNRRDDPVLVSPSMKEGVSLEDDQCRFIGLCKMPYPYLGSPQIAARLQSLGGQKWYAWKTMCDVIQMTGRGQRSKEDWCAVYIWDAHFKMVFNQMRKHVPTYWKADLIDVQAAL